MTYSQICSNLLKRVPEKHREVLSRRFGLVKNEKETLEAIGIDHHVTRERVRQIEKEGFEKLKLRPELKQFKSALGSFAAYFKKSGGLKREDLLLGELGGDNERNQVNFLLSLSPNFERFGESADLYSFWQASQSSQEAAKKAIFAVYSKLKKIGTPAELNEIAPNPVLKKNVLLSYLEVSKKIQQNSEGLFGLADWPEINPRGVKDKAYLVFKKEGKPLHFNQVASLMGQALPQTVHNELIKDQRFVLVGRGLYALSEWGYESGCVKDIISKAIKDSKNPLTKEEIVERVLKQRFVKENTVYLNLSNKKHFFKTEEGYYQVREA